MGTFSKLICTTFPEISSNSETIHSLSRTPKKSLTLPQIGKIANLFQNRTKLQTWLTIGNIAFQNWSSNQQKLSILQKRQVPRGTQEWGSHTTKRNARVAGLMQGSCQEERKGTLASPPRSSLDLQCFKARRNARGATCTRGTPEYPCSSVVFLFYFGAETQRNATA